jgi:Asp-tRNA(Asn)/Glu-tRNA(Gln) amidotransferase C subunit
LYKRLLSDQVILLNCKFSLKINSTIRKYFNNDKIRKPNYLISNLDLSYNRIISDKDFKLLFIDLKGKYFHLKKLYMNNYSQKRITNQSFHYLFENNNDLIELEIANCSKLITSEIIKKYLFSSSSNLLRIQNLNLFGCNNLLMNESNDEKNFKRINLNYLKKLNLDYCDNATNEIIENLINLEELSIVGYDKTTSDAFKKLEKLKKLNISSCNKFDELLFINLNKAITTHVLNDFNNNCNFETNLIELDISSCNQVNDSWFKYLKNLKVLKMSRCNQEELTSQSFQYLTNLLEFEMDGCNQKTIKGEDFKYLKKLKILSMRHCKQKTIKNEHFKYLSNLVKLNISECQQLNLDLLFNYLVNLEELNMSDCQQDSISDLSFKKLKKLKILSIRTCNQKSLTDKLFKYLPNLIELDISYCNQFSDKAFQYFGKNLEILSMNNCSQELITNKAFSYLKNIKCLEIEFCSQETITNHFLDLIADELLYLNVVRCSQIELDLNDLKNLKNLKTFQLDKSNAIDELRVRNVLKNCHFNLF